MAFYSKMKEGATLLGKATVKFAEEKKEQHEAYKEKYRKYNDKYLVDTFMRTTPSTSGYLALCAVLKEQGHDLEALNRERAQKLREKNS
jgi:hypothetical protein